MGTHTCILNHHSWSSYCESGEIRNFACDLTDCLLTGSHFLVLFLPLHLGVNHFGAPIMTYTDFTTLEFVHQQILRLFQHTFGTHPEQLLPTGYKPGFLSSFALPGDCRTGVRYRGVLQVSWTDGFTPTPAG